jgi:ribulose bisphosphate carboxylase small subunit
VDRESILEARERAERLFLSSLSEDQLEQYNRHREICLTGSGGGKYVLECRNARVQNVTGRGFRFCISLKDKRIPKHDVWLAQKLIIEHAEDEFLKQANIQINIERPKEIDYGGRWMG